MEEDVAPTLEEYVPAAQLVHDEAPALDHSPARQDTHVEEDVAPTVEE